MEYQLLQILDMVDYLPLFYTLEKHLLELLTFRESFLTLVFSINKVYTYLIKQKEDPYN